MKDLKDKLKDTEIEYILHEADANLFTLSMVIDLINGISQEDREELTLLISRIESQLEKAIVLSDINADNYRREKLRNDLLKAENNKLEIELNRLNRCDELVNELSIAADKVRRRGNTWYILQPSTGKYRTIRGMNALGYTLYDREGNEITCDEDLEKVK